MKRLITVSTLGMMLALGGNALAADDKHPNITAAHKSLDDALAKLTDAQKANEYDMQGHAQKAKDLVEKALKELKSARGAANANAPAK